MLKCGMPILPWIVCKGRVISIVRCRSGSSQSQSGSVDCRSWLLAGRRSHSCSGSGSTGRWYRGRRLLWCWRRARAARGACGSWPLLFVGIRRPVRVDAAIGRWRRRCLHTLEILLQNAHLQGRLTVGHTWPRLGVVGASLYRTQYGGRSLVDGRSMVFVGWSPRACWLWLLGRLAAILSQTLRGCCTLRTLRLQAVQCRGTRDASGRIPGFDTTTGYVSWLNDGSLGGRRGASTRPSG